MRNRLLYGVTPILSVILTLSQVSACALSVSPIEPGVPSAATVSVLATGLEIPWSLCFLPDGDILITERPGRIRLYDRLNGLIEQPLLEVPGVLHRGEGGLLGIEVHPQYALKPFLYVYHTYQDGQNVANRVVRYDMSGTLPGEPEVIIDGIPGAGIHNGGRIKFGPDGCLYVCTGDAAVPDLAQRPDSLAGKILRLAEDGSVPADNPFAGSPIYSLGHRNPQGLAWDEGGRLLATEHGASATDELNLIVGGRNYGWPTVRGDERVSGLEVPLVHSAADTWAPSGLAYLDGSLYFAGLRGVSLFQVALPSTDVVGHLRGQYGRLRDVVLGPDGNLYLLTNNRDGRGLPALDDDRLIRVDPNRL